MMRYKIQSFFFYFSVFFVGWFVHAPSYAFAQVYLSEVAWMGVSVPESSKDEWIELYNDGDAVSLVGWKLTWGTNGTKSATLPASIGAGAYIIVSGSTLVNTGEFLVLKNAQGVIEDSVDGSNNWIINGEKKGNNDSSPKQTMQRNGEPAVGEWVTAPPTPLAGALVQSTQSASLSVAQTSATTSGASSGGRGGGVLVGVSREELLKKARLSIGLPKEYVLVVDTPSLFHAQPQDERNDSPQGVDIRWNFGDGTTAEGNDVEHTYRYAGEYVLVVSVKRMLFSKSITTTERRTVGVLAEQIRISDATSAYVELENVSDREVDISDTILKGTDTFFFIPEQTILLPETKVRFSREVTGVDSTKGIELVRETNGTLIAQNTPTHLVPNRLTQNTVRTSSKNLVSSATRVAPSPPTERLPENIVQTLSAQTQTSTKEAFPKNLAGAYGRVAETAEKQTSVWWWISALVASLILVIVVILLVRREEQEVLEGYTLEE